LELITHARVLLHNNCRVEDQLPVHRHTPYYIFLDEVGRGCLAGPVVVGGCLWIPSQETKKQGEIPSWKNLRSIGVKDSKKVPEKKRALVLTNLGVNPFISHGESLEIAQDQFFLMVDQMEVDAIECINILAATIKLMGHVSISLLKLANISEGDVTVIIDGKEKIPQLFHHNVIFHQLAIPKSDLLFAPTGLASLYAKVYRDYQMDVWNSIYPNFDLGQHKGYGTAKHLESIKRYGPSPIHRRTFAGVKEYFSGATS